MLLSTCIIARNEQKNIARLLESIKSYEVEIVVVDTGSEDDTKQIAGKYTDKVYDFVWCDDFAAAKNFAVSKATNPYILVLDSDEYIEEFDETILERLLTDHSCKVGRIQCKNIFTKDGVRREDHEWINRIFAKDRFRYAGRIHEQIVAIDGMPYETYRAPIVIGHTGYDLTGEERWKKAERNIGLLQRELSYLLEKREVSCVQDDIEKCKMSVGIDEQIPYILYQLGKSYYMIKNYEVACEYFSQGLSYDLNPKLEYVVDMVEMYGYALVNSGHVKEALCFENIYDEFCGSADFQFLMGIIYMNNARFEKAISEFLKATKHTVCKNQGANSYAAYYNIGVICECLGRKEAWAYYKRCGNYEPAMKRLESGKHST